MKISNDEALRARRIEPVSPKPATDIQIKPTAAQGNGPAAQVELSAQAQALSAAKAEAAHFLPAIQAAPETRDDLVSRLKAQIEGGSYHVSGADIADQMVRRAKADGVL